MQHLFQEDPLSKNYYIPKDKNGNPCKNRSYTANRESYQNGACKKTRILRWNGRIPTQEFVLHFLKELLPEDIRERRRRIFRYLKEHGLEAVANIELTKDLDGTPNNCVHFTLITDDPRSETEIRTLFETACWNCGLIKDIDFCITYEKLTYGYWRFNYFTKYGVKYFYEVILFEPGTGLDKFYTIGKWFRKPQKQIWEDIKAFMAAKDVSNPDDPDSNNNVDISEDELPSEAIENNTPNSVVIEPSVEIDDPAMDWTPPVRNDCPSDYDYHLPAARIPDRRQDWQRFKYSVSFRQ